MTTLCIRRLVADDVVALQAIDLSAHNTSWSTQVYRDEIERDDRVHLVGVDATGAMVGHASGWVDSSTGRITNVAVDRSHRGCGHGRRLLAAVLDQMLSCFRLDRIALEVRSDNIEAQALYREFGFAPVGLVRNFYEPAAGASCDALVMAVDGPLDTNFATRCRQVLAAGELSDPPAATTGATTRTKTGSETGAAA